MREFTKSFQKYFVKKKKTVDMPLLNNSSAYVLTDVWLPGACPCWQSVIAPSSLPGACLTQFCSSVLMCPAKIQ